MAVDAEMLFRAYLRTKERKRAQKILRDAQKIVCVKEYEAFEEGLEKYLHPLFQRQLDSAATRLAEIGDGVDEKSPNGNVNASALASQIFNPNEWYAELVDRALPPIAQAMFDVAMRQYELMRMQSQKCLNISHKASTATEWLAGNATDLLEEMDFVTPYGTYSIGISTEFPPWMKRSIEERLRESFIQDYWSRVNLTTYGDIEKFLETGLRDGHSITRMAMNIREQLYETGKYATSRARNIARTESANALNGARVASMDSLLNDLGPDIPAKKTWLSVLANTTRAEHADLDGVPANKQGTWNLVGQFVRWPGDINLPPSQRCNCMCSVVVEFGMTDGEAGALWAEYELRQAAQGKRSFGPVRLWSRGGPGSGNFGHQGRPGYVGGAGQGGFGPVVNNEGKYIPGAVGKLSGTADMAKGWKINYTLTQWALKKVHKLEELAAAGDWEGYDKAKFVPKAKYLEKYHKMILAAQDSLDKLKTQSASAQVHETPPKTAVNPNPKPEVSVSSQPAGEPAEPMVVKSEMHPYAMKLIAPKPENGLAGQIIGSEVYSVDSGGYTVNVKTFDESGQASEAHFAMSIAHEMGLPIPKKALIEHEGKLGIATEYKSGVQEVFKGIGGDKVQEEVGDHIGTVLLLNAANPKEGTTAFGTSAGGLSLLDPTQTSPFESNMSISDFAKGKIPGLAKLTPKQVEHALEKVKGLTKEKVELAVAKAFAHKSEAYRKAHVVAFMEKQMLAEMELEEFAATMPPINPFSGKLGLKPHTALTHETMSGAGEIAKAALDDANWPSYAASAQACDKMTLSMGSSKLSLAEKYKAVAEVPTKEGAGNAGTVHAFKQELITQLEKQAAATGVELPKVKMAIAPPDPAPTKIDASKLPATPTFLDGKYKAGNEEIAGQALAYAKAGDISALQGMSIPPSPKLKAFHAKLLAETNLQLNPPPPPKPAVKLKTLDETVEAVAAKLPAKLEGPAEKALKYTMLLADVDGMPKGVPTTSYQASGEQMSELNSSHVGKMAGVKQFLRRYTGSGYKQINSELRGTQPLSENVRKKAEAVLRKAPELPVGMELRRGNSAGLDHMEKDIIAGVLKPGAVVADRGLLSTSMSTGFGGEVRWKLTVGPGVRGWAVRKISNHPSEDEVVLPPNQRILITNVVETGNTYNGKYEVEAVILPTTNSQCCPP